MVKTNLPNTVTGSETILQFYFQKTNKISQPQHLLNESLLLIRLHFVDTKLSLVS